MTGFRGEDRELAELLPVHYAIDSQRSSYALTPRMACRLLVQAEVLADLVRRDSGYLTEDDSVLPPAALRRATDEFLDRFSRCFDDLANRLRSPAPTGQLANCVGDEVALDHILQVARGAWDDGTEREVIGTVLDALPENRELDTDFEHYAEVLFEDRDFELLWRPEFDGIEDDEDAVVDLRLVNLRPDRWFLPFT